MSAKDRQHRVRKAASMFKDPSLTVEGVRLQKVETFSGAKMSKLQIDESYQRVEIKSWVNRLIAILEAGHDIPDPISVVKRPDGSLFIVDGQQRYWAHWNCDIPIKAQIFVFDEWSLKAETTFFQILNSRKRLSSMHVINTWPGPAGDLMRSIDTEVGGALAGEVGWTQGTKFGATQVLKAVYTAGVGSRLGGSIDRVLERLDREIMRAPKRFEKVAEMVPGVLKACCPDGERLRTVEAVALGLACYEHWHDLRTNAEWPVPTTRQARSIRKIHWRQIAPTTNGIYVRPAVNEVLRKWKVKS